MPTEDQLKSRAEVKSFVQRVGRTIHALPGKMKSAWFSRPDDELKGWIERGRAISEIEDSMGYKLIMDTVDREILWAQAQLETCAETEVRDLRMYLRALRFMDSFILTTHKNADIATGVLAGREAEIGKTTTTFITSAQVRN